MLLDRDICQEIEFLSKTLIFQCLYLRMSWTLNISNQKFCEIKQSNFKRFILSIYKDIGIRSFEFVCDDIMAQSRTAVTSYEINLKSPIRKNCGNWNFFYNLTYLVFIHIYVIQILYNLTFSDIYRFFPDFLLFMLALYRYTVNARKTR